MCPSMHHPGSQPLIKPPVLMSRFLCSEGLRAALPLAGRGQRAKLDMCPSPAINAPTNTGAGLVASPGAMMEEGARQRWGPEGERCSGAMEAKTKERDEVGKAERAVASPLPGTSCHEDAARCVGRMQWMQS